VSDRSFEVTFVVEEEEEEEERFAQQTRANYCRVSGSLLREIRLSRPNIDIPEGESSGRSPGRLKLKAFPAGSSIVAFRSHARGRASHSGSFICALSHFVFLFDKQPTLRRSFGSAKTGLVPDPISQQQLTADPRAT
jgi:hypothetical protein